MSLSITISSINDLTDAERAVLQTVLGINADRPLTSAKDAIQETIDGPQQYAAGCGHPTSENGRLACDECSDKATSAIVSSPLPPASAELDTNGLPWDKRIHSSSRAKVADGRWRYLRGVEPMLIEKVEAELRAVQALPVPRSPEQYEPTTDGDNSAAIPVAEAATFANNAMADFVGMAPSLLTEAQNTPIVPPAPAPAPAPMTFSDLMKHITPMLTGNKLTQDQIIAIAAEFGLPHLAALGARPDLVEAVRVRIDEVCNGAA